MRHGYPRVLPHKPLRCQSGYVSSMSAPLSEEGPGQPAGSPLCLASGRRHWRLHLDEQKKLWRCPPLAGAPGAAGSGQELTVSPGRSRHAVLKLRVIYIKTKLGVEISAWRTLNCTEREHLRNSCSVSNEFRALSLKNLCDLEARALCSSTPCGILPCVLTLCLFWSSAGVLQLRLVRRHEREEHRGAVRIGCGRYDWEFSTAPQHRAISLVITIETMVSLPAETAPEIFEWLVGLPPTFYDAKQALAAAPRQESLAPVLAYLISSASRL